MYIWRKLTPEARARMLEQRVRNQVPWRVPPLWECGHRHYLLTAACYEHLPIIGVTEERMNAFEDAILESLEPVVSQIVAWVLLPNHYHVLVSGDDVQRMRKTLGLLHGRTSRQWNLEDTRPARRVFHGSAETYMKSDRHLSATLNYIHHNPVKHRYVEKWTDWKWSSATAFLEEHGRETTAHLWKEYPIDDYGNDWDPVGTPVGVPASAGSKTFTPLIKNREEPPTR
ncbi:MAG: hypothetical protein SFY80_08700 [Verrucomicrobiota bacterium]|nr:hypothetical protein [Verrucomicrobiota bacterium]